jgi:hypothetical protein
LRKEEYELAKKLAASKGVSMSQVIGDALRAVDAEHTLDDPLAHLIGKLEDARPDGSECHDEVIYATDIR